MVVERADRGTVRVGRDPDSVWAAVAWAVVVAGAQALAEEVREPAQEAPEAEAVPAAKVCGGLEEGAEPVQAAREAEAQAEDQGPAAGRVVVRVEDQEAVMAPAGAAVELVADLAVVGGEEPQDQAVPEVAQVVGMVAVEEGPVVRVAPAAAQVLVERVAEVEVEAPERALPGNG